MSKLNFLLNSADIAPVQPATPHYVGADPNMLFPPKGEPVYIDHPYFLRDEYFSNFLSASAFGWLLRAGNNKKEAADRMLSWLEGDKPIPEDILEVFIRNREKFAKAAGVDIEPARAPDLASTDQRAEAAMSKPSFLRSSGRVAPVKPDTPHYEGADPNNLFPPKAEAVYIDHPYFLRDGYFANALSAAAFCWVLKAGNNKQEAADEMWSWLKGDKPIPDDILEMFISNREKFAKADGVDIELARAPEEPARAPKEPARAPEEPARAPELVETD